MNNSEPRNKLLDEKYIHGLSDDQFAAVFERLREKIESDPLEYFVKSELFCNFKPVAGQVVALKLIFDQPLCGETVHRIAEQTGEDDTGNPIFGWQELDEWEIYKYLTGEDYHLDKVGHDIKNLITLCLGRRGGKTSLAGILGLWSAIRKDWRALRDKKGNIKKKGNDYVFFGLGDKEFGEVKVLSRSVGYSEDILTEMKAKFDRSPILKRLLDKEGEQSKGRLTLKIPSLRDGALAYCTIKITVDAATSDTARGGATIFAMLDECAFLHQDEKYVNSLNKVLAALQPSLKQFGDYGILVLSSTPSAKIGPFYERVIDPHRFGKKHLKLQGESWIFNNILTLKDWEQAYRDDPIEFPTEYQAKFIDSKSQFFRAEAVENAVNKGVVEVDYIKNQDISYVAALDAAYKGDRFAFTVVSVRREEKETKIEQVHQMVWERRSRKDEVDLREVGHHISKIVTKYNLDIVYADQYGYIPLRELFKDRHNITLEEYPFTAQSKKLIYKNLQTLIDQGDVKLLDDRHLVGELVSMELEITEAGQIKIYHPPGKHDDRADAFALACYKGVEKAEMLFSIEPESTFGVKTYGIQTDKKTGAAFSAPSVDMLRTESKKYKDFSGVNDNTDLYDLDDLGNVIRPVFHDKLGMPLYEDDLRTEYPSIYRDYLEGKIITQKDFEKAQAMPDHQTTLGSEFLF